MHALIIADIEGITDIYDLENIDDCAKLYNSEIQVCIQTLVNKGITKITVCDAHNEGNLISLKSILHEDLNSYNTIRLISRVDNLDFNVKYDFALQ